MMAGAFAEGSEGCTSNGFLADGSRAGTLANGHPPAAPAVSSSEDPDPLLVPPLLDPLASLLRHLKPAS